MEKNLVEKERFLSHKINLEKIRAYVGESLSQTSLTEDDIYRFQLAVDEACSNIIMHNYEGDNDKPIYITIKQSDKNITIIIEDEGEKFNPLDVSDPDLDQHIERYKQNGLGVYLMRRLVDEIVYHAGMKRGNKIELVKYLD